jgi:ribosomal protein S18 acetylase RimI-like enzyme
MGPNRGEGRSTADAGPVAVRDGTATDAEAAARLHAGQIADGFLSFLGPGFLTRLYRRVTVTPGSFLLVAEDAHGVVGFVAGTSDLGGLYRTFLVKDGLGALAASAGRLLRGWRRALETLRHGASPGAGTGRGVELLSIAVDPSQQGRGAGGKLVAAFLGRVQADRDSAAYVVVAADNGGAVRLYERAGFTPVDRFELHPGTTSLVMQWDDDRSAASGPGEAR